VYVLDNGSEDGTWEIVLDLSRKWPGIMPHAHEDCVFQPSLRSRLFGHYRGNASTGDWWCRLDADEFYIDDPREFLACVPNLCHVVWSSSFQYYFTDKDLERYSRDPSLHADNVPIEQKLRYYLNNGSEIRFVRHRDELRWDDDEPWPRNAGAPYPYRIRLKHFQWRSPAQIQERLDTRVAAIDGGCKSFRHERVRNWHERLIDRSTARVMLPDDLSSLSWRDRIVSSDSLVYDAHDGRYASREESPPSIKGLRRFGPRSAAIRLASWWSRPDQATEQPFLAESDRGHPEPT